MLNLFAQVIFKRDNSADMIFMHYTLIIDTYKPHVKLGIMLNTTELYKFDSSLMDLDVHSRSRD